MTLSEEIQAMVRVVPDHPQPGIMYQDMASIFNHPSGLTKVIQAFQEQNIIYDRIVGLDARGFPMAGALSAITGKPFVMARKKGKLPGETISTEYELEYGTDELHLQTDSVLDDDRVLIIDDVIATAKVKAVEFFDGTKSNNNLVSNFNPPQTAVPSAIWKVFLYDITYEKNPRTNTKYDISSARSIVSEDVFGQNFDFAANILM
mgnify:CR=1 FL=1